MFKAIFLSEIEFQLWKHNGNYTLNEVNKNESVKNRRINNTILHQRNMV